MNDREMLSSSAQFAEAGLVSTNKVLRNTYMLLGMTLAFSAVTAGVSMAMNFAPMPWWMMLAGMFGLLFFVQKTADSAMGLLAIFAFTGFMGFTLGPMLNFYLAIPGGSQLVMQALGGTALVFFGLSAYALTTRKDFSFMGGFLMTGLIVLVVAMIANIFVDIPMLSLVISGVAVMVMSGLILFDTSRIVHGGETNYIRATVSLYLSIYNLFVHLLHLFAVLSGGDD